MPSPRMKTTGVHTIDGGRSTTPVDEMGLVLFDGTRMYELRVHRGFHASHALRLYDGSEEEEHAHDWQVYADLRADELDAIDVVMDFHALEAALQDVLRPLDGRRLNDLDIFARTNPSAERVAEHIFGQLRPHLPPRVALSRITVTEAPGCHASYSDSHK